MVIDFVCGFLRKITNIYNLMRVLITHPPLRAGR